MKRPKAHKINEKGMRLFEDTLPESWVTNPQGKDYGKDYLVEIGEDSEELSGDSFFVQLKSVAKAKPDSTGSYVSFGLKSNHARYYSKVKDLPVFLVIADIETQTCWFEFLQPILLKNRSFLHKKEITIRVPTENSVANHNDFLKAINAAKSWLRARYPSSIVDAAKAKEEELEAIDPRFKPSLSYKNGAVNVTMNPIESVQLNLQFKGKAATKKLYDLRELGKPATFQSTEITITGSKLFDVYDFTKVEVIPRNSEGKLVFSDCETLRESKYRSSEFPLTIRGGTKQMTFRSEAERSPFEVEIIACNMGGDTTSWKLRVGFKPENWDQLPICHLPFFSPINDLFSHLASENSIHVHFMKDGNSIATEFLDGIESSDLIHISRLLNDMSKARSICQKKNLNPIWTLDAFCEVGPELDRVYELVENGSWKGNGNGADISGKLVPTNMKEFLKMTRDGKKTQHLLLTREMWFDLMGKEIYIGQVAHEFTEMKPDEKMKRNLQSKGKKNKSNSNLEIPFSYKATPNSEHIFRLVKEGELGG